MWSMKFEETGGYDCMTGAWIIQRDDETVVAVDQCNFGQQHCDYEFRSLEAKTVAEKIFYCLSAGE